MGLAQALARLQLCFLLPPLPPHLLLPLPLPLPRAAMRGAWQRYRPNPARKLLHQARWVAARRPLTAPPLLLLQMQQLLQQLHLQQRLQLQLPLLQLRPRRMLRLRRRLPPHTSPLPPPASTLQPKRSAPLRRRRSSC